MLVCCQEWEKNWLIQPWLWQTIKGIVTSNRHRLSITFGSRYLEIIKLFLTYAQTFLWPCCSGGRGEMLFGPDNLGDAAISGFLQKHSCGACCRRLGLTGQKMFSIAVCVSVCLCGCVCVASGKPAHASCFFENFCGWEQNCRLTNMDCVAPIICKVRPKFQVTTSKLQTRDVVN